MSSEASRVRFAQWMTHMRGGNFAAAWGISDRVLVERRGRSCENLPLHQRWLWSGESIIGQRVLIRCYHVLGDTLQFIRYLPLVRQLARRGCAFTYSNKASLLTHYPMVLACRRSAQTLALWRA